MSALVTKSPVTTEDFARYEFKYLLNARLREEIENDISHFMTYDGHVDENLGNQYFVRSLYYDTPTSRHYHEKIDGTRLRRKFRLRTYGHAPDPDVPIYLEEKGRHVERTFKHRIAISAAHLEMFYAPDRHPELLDIYDGAEIVERLIYSALRRRISPVVAVDYIRRPYNSPFDIHFRLTFDSHLQAAASGILFPDQSANWRLSEAGHTILEVKFQRRLPAWFHRIVQVYGMRRLSISKFCKGMEVCDLAVDLS